MSVSLDVKSALILFYYTSDMGLTILQIDCKA